VHVHPHTCASSLYFSPLHIFISFTSAGWHTQTSSGRFLTLGEFERLMVEADVIFVGEYHDHVMGHATELLMLEELCVVSHALCP
jgi:uncharacterized iron-regulated protein